MCWSAIQKHITENQLQMPPPWQSPEPYGHSDLIPLLP